MKLVDGGLIVALLTATAFAIAKGSAAETQLTPTLMESIAKGTDSITSYDVYATSETNNLMKAVMVGKSSAANGSEIPKFELKRLPKDAPPSIRTLNTHQVRSAQGKERVEKLTRPLGELTEIHTFDGLARNTFTP